MVRTGDWIVRLDQPYSATVSTLLAIQKFKADDPPPYDDTGWTLDALRHVETIKVADSTIFTRPMQLLTQDATVAGSTPASGSTLHREAPWRLEIGGSSVEGSAARSGVSPTRVHRRAA